MLSADRKRPSAGSYKRLHEVEAALYLVAGLRAGLMHIP